MRFPPTRTYGCVFSTGRPSTAARHASDYQLCTTLKRSDSEKGMTREETQTHNVLVILLHSEKHIRSTKLSKMIILKQLLRGFQASLQNGVPIKPAPSARSAEQAHQPPKKKIGCFLAPNYMENFHALFGISKFSMLFLSMYILDRGGGMGAD